MLKAFFARLKSKQRDAEIQAKMDAKIQAENDSEIQAENDFEIQAKKKANIHNLYLSKLCIIRLDLLRTFGHKSTC